MPTIARSDTRNTDLAQLTTMLKDQRTRAADVIAGTGAFHVEGGHLHLDRTEPQLHADGVSMTTGRYRINDIALQGLSAKLDIPLPYLRRCHQDNPDLFDHNVNAWLARTDQRFLIRVLRDGTGGGIARAFLSDRYLLIDNLDVMLAALDGVRRSGVPVNIDGCDLTDRRMFIRIYSPAVQAMAPQLLANYRSPFDRRPGAELPVVWGGFLLSNSDTGCGAFTLAPRLFVRVCRNGMVIEKDMLRRVHLGSRHTQDGIIEASDETITKTLELITSRTTDAVKAFLDPEYVARTVRNLEQIARTPITDPDATVKLIGKSLRFSEDHQAAILAHFIVGSDLSAGGIMHAVSSVAQTVDDADAAHDLEVAAVDAMRIAATA